MSTIVGVCSCSVTRTLTISFSQNPPTPVPLGGYYVRWRIVDAQGNRGVWNESGPYFTNPISLPGVPACCNIEGEVKASCGTGADGQPLFGTPAPFGANATVSYNVTFTQGSCVNGDGTFTIVGTPGQRIQVKLALSGTITHDTAASGSQCAWMSGSIEARGIYQSGVSTTTSNGGTSVLSLPDSMVVAFTLPAAGTTTSTQVSVNILTNLKIFNALNATGLTGTIQILSVDGVTVNGLTYPVCVENTTAIGCSPRP